VNKSCSYDSANSNATTHVPSNWNQIPSVQYGFPEGEGPKRSPKLRTIFEPIPEGAETASPIYHLEREQYERQQALDSGYAIAGDHSSIATELQDECEEADNVVYPIHIESDAYHREGPATLIRWYQEFTENYLDVPLSSCTLYFSGNRSIHVHVPRFVSGEKEREHLRGLAETFCNETGADLDCGLYYAKRLFRLPGVEHAKSGLPKVEIEPEWDQNRIFRETNGTTPDIPNSYEAVLRNVFTTQPRLTVDTPDTTLDPPLDLFQTLDSDETVLEFDIDETDTETPLIEQIEYPANAAEAKKWLQYNAKEFSPYALADGNPRSVASLKVMGSGYARQDVRDGSTLVPAYFYGAQGCAGDKFTKEQEHAPLQLSAHDYKKWDYESGDRVVIIGGQSRRSRMLEVKPWVATNVGQALTGEEASRQAALDYLDNKGYDTGTSGSREAKNRDYTRRRRPESDIPPVRNPITPAGKLQKRAEQNGIETLTHDERWRVACRVLYRGWKPAWDWFKTQYGAAFKPDVTREQFGSIIETFPNDYNHVEVQS